MVDDLERRAGKGAEDEHPPLEGGASDHSDFSDPRVSQPGEREPQRQPDADNDPETEDGATSPA